jgi:hypothetical protein
MHPMLRGVFVLQIAFQCRAITLASRGIDAAIARLNAGDADRAEAMDELWYSVQALLNAAANISKACWGQSGSLTKERKPIRQALGIKETSPIRSTGMRNNFDHFDERIDKWWAESKNHNFADQNVGSVHGLDPLDSFRALDPTTLEVIFWGKRYDLRQIVAEAQRLEPIAATLLREFP